MKKNKNRLSEEEEQNRIKKIESEISSELESLKQLDKESKKAKNEDIKSMIKYYITLTSEIENRRTRIHSFMIQMLAIYVTAASFLSIQYQKACSTILGSIIFWGIIGALLIQIILSLCSIFLYEKQSGFRYPFLNLEKEKYGNQWKWFYYGDKKILDINVKATSDPKTTIEPYLKSLKDLVHDYREEDLDKELSNNIIQLHLLRVHNYYKNQFFLQLTGQQKLSIKVWLWSICIILISVVVCPVILRYLY